MQKDALNNVHISAEQVLITPEELKNQFPLSVADEARIATARKTIADILQGRDPVCWWSAGRVLSMIRMRRWTMPVVCKHWRPT
ncbi:Phospho-2-dehydro-3-deoxyheptonate aldolase, Tyr-sensitive [Serratia rubidaea]|uniref:Phospho-2-dehydro-3-deoxyheptonate aldolase, Tyr-sensitive n=1 Tax=Serratia rubidaea TaxID=61652 RepID=A0A447QPN8_SERRU|nr:Phospho-2-dehydro-3-deoxyheptonate aldolase, Tyr-sensitive [Serratia rubidaea]